MTPTAIILIALGLVLILALLLRFRVLKVVGFVALSVVIVLIALLVAIKFSQVKTMMASKWSMPPQPVTTATVSEQAWEPVLTAVGSLTAVQGVTIAAQLDGNVTKIAFEPGSVVKAGDLILQQDVTSETAQLHSAEAASKLAGLNRKRSHELLANATISQAQFDADDATFQQTQAQEGNIHATIEKKTIRAPFAGRLGIRLINLGQTLKAGDAIVSLQALDPIFADFFLPQQDLAQISRGTTVRLTSDALPNQTMTGKITAINPDVDSATRSVKVEATFANPGEHLHPGMYVNVGVVLPVGKKVMVIPATSPLYAPYGDSVFIIDQKKDGSGQVLRQQFIRLGERRGDFVAVISGLKPGDQVVTTGAFKLRNGMEVKIDNTLAPHAELAPKPEDS